jgi:hypothetical protein
MRVLQKFVFLHPTVGSRCGVQWARFAIHVLEGFEVACPFFMPVEKLEGGWMHAHRLPLGCGWSGKCAAPGHEGQTPSDEELRELCNLGYAARCARLPREREWDSVRFGAKAARMQEEGPANFIQIRYVCEREHRPAENGFLEYQPVVSKWKQEHRNPRLQRMAECYLESWMEKRLKTAG